MFWVFVRIVSLTYVVFFLKYLIHYSCIICDLLYLKRKCRDSQIVIITNFVVVSSVCIKMVVCHFTVSMRDDAY